jgi:hypothetical protein
MAEFLKILSVFISCIFFFAKVGVPSAILLFKFNFLKVFIVTVSSGIFGTIVFTYFSAALIKWWSKFNAKKNLLKKKKVFSKGNRRIITIKNKFGLAGLAAIMPIVPGIAIGSFLAERFFSNKQKIILYFSISIMVWSVGIYLLFYFFKKTVF